MIFSRTDLRISQSKVKNCKESAGNIRFDLDPQKTGQNAEKRTFETISFDLIFFGGAEKRSIRNCPKRVFPKFGGCPSQVRRVNGRSKFCHFFSPQMVPVGSDDGPQ